MKVALLTTPQARYADYWLAFLGALGLDVPRPLAPYDVWMSAGQASLPEEPILTQLALGEILSLGNQVDVVLVPQRLAVTNDAWAEHMAELLPQRISGLPTLIAVPDQAEELAMAAATIGMRLVHNRSTVARAMERVEKLGQVPRRSEWPMLQVAGKASVAVVGPRALVSHPDMGSNLIKALERAGVHPVPTHRLPLLEVNERGARHPNPKATLAERRLWAEARLAEGKGSISGLVLVAPARDVAMYEALRAVQAELYKPSLLLSADAGQEHWNEINNWADNLPLPS